MHQPALIDRQIDLGGDVEQPLGRGEIIGRALEELVIARRHRGAGQPRRPLNLDILVSRPLLGARAGFWPALLISAILYQATMTNATMTKVKYDDTMCPNGKNSDFIIHGNCVGQGGGL